MDHILHRVIIPVHSSTYLKNPESSELGKKIVKGSIDLLDNIGFEDFNFKKLASSIESTEASVYRYFESKHKLLLYLTNWYWAWMEYRLLFKTTNIDSPRERLERALSVLIEDIQQDGNFDHINEIKLNGIVIDNSSKTYLTKEVDKENKEGIFKAYKQLVQRVSNIIQEINPNYKYPHMLVSTVIEGTHIQRYFAQHIPMLTDVVKGEDATVEFYKKMVFKTLDIIK